MDHSHGRHGRVEALPPTMSLMRLSAWQRLAGVGLVLAVLWGIVALVIGFP